jgi:nucleoside-diphosphate-sugar epimerase
MTTLIAGCGDLGINIAKRLISKNQAVIGLRRHPPTSNAALSASNTKSPAINPALPVIDLASNDLFEWLAVDLRDPATLKALSKISQTITQVVYSATPDQRTPEQYQASYLEGLQNLSAVLGSDALIGHQTRRWVFVSSTAVYGASKSEWVDETSPAQPDGFNGKVLLETEQFLHQNHQNSVVMRLSGIYGPGRNQIVQRIQQGLVTAPIEPPHYTNRIHIDDAARAIEHILSLQNPESIYVVTDQHPLPMHTLYNHIAKQLGAPPVLIGPSPAGMSSKRLSSRRLVDSGFQHLWPDAQMGYDALLKP